MHFPKPIPTLILTLCMAAVIQCASIPGSLRPPDRSAAIAGTDDGRLTVAQAYAGEVLAYLLQVVLGRSGDPTVRETWRRCALGEPLDFKAISKAMDTGDKSRFLVRDANILGLSSVLYHYDPQLNQFKGAGPFASLYPSTELVALRLFMLTKLAGEEAVDLDAILARTPLITTPGRAPTPADMEAMNLRPEEFNLLQAVIVSEPRFLSYMRHPFLVSAYDRLGLIRMGREAQRLRDRAHYRDSACQAVSSDKVDLLLVPSMTTAFSWKTETDGNDGFRPTDSYRSVLETLKKDILTAVMTRLGVGGKRVENPSEARLKDRIVFHEPMARPLAIYPENADDMIGDLCPGVDFTVILLGKDVYRAMDLDPGRNIYPAVDRIYLDESAIRYGQVGEALDQIGRFIASALGASVSGDADPGGAEHPGRIAQAIGQDWCGQVAVKSVVPDP